MQKSYLIAGAVVVVVVVAAVIGVLVMRSGGDQAAGGATPVSSPPPEPTPTPGLQARLSERLQGTTLATADEVLPGLVAELSSHPELMKWMANDDMLRRVVAAVNNIAEGKTPRSHLDFLRPETPFAVVERNGSRTVDPSSWARYDLIADVFTSLDTAGVVALYQELSPLLDDAYREIAPADRRFHDRLQQAIAHLLAAPVPATDVRLKPKVLTYTYEDPKLEGLSEAQRQLLRMGPDNEQAVQAKLRELQEALAAPPAMVEESQPAPAEEAGE